MVKLLHLVAQSIPKDSLHTVTDVNVRYQNKMRMV